MKKIDGNGLARLSAAQYASISPTPDSFEAFSGTVPEMWKTLPAFTGEQSGSM